MKRTYPMSQGSDDITRLTLPLWPHLAAGRWIVQLGASLPSQNKERRIKWTTIAVLIQGSNPPAEPPSSSSPPRGGELESTVQKTVIPNEVPPSTPRSEPQESDSRLPPERLPFYPLSSQGCEKSFCCHCPPATLSLSRTSFSNPCSQSLGVTTNKGEQDGQNYRKGR